MKWIETLELRSISREDPLKEMDLQTLVSNMTSASKPYLVIFFQHVNIKGDACVHLLFDTDRVPPDGSEPGFQLKELFRDSGLVSHKIWVESKSFQVSENPDIDL